MAQSTSIADLNERTLPPTLTHLMSVWPILESIATYLSVGDLILLSRTCSNMRVIMHGGLPNERNRIGRELQQAEIPLRPRIGQHQTPFWRLLKSKSSFTCSSKTHTRGDKARACVYCSVPICEACIVRDSFKRHNENTFRNRSRYLCHVCWAQGRPVKSFRYSSQTGLTSSNNGPVPPYTEEASLDPDTFEDLCTCTLKDDGWLCLDCKDRQNSSPIAMSSLQKEISGTIECFGFTCSNTVQLSNPEKDRRRICLWCEKSLKRQFGSEDCYMRHARFFELCAANATSRIQDLEESDRNLLVGLNVQIPRMSRNEMHGTDKTGQDKLELIRDLDCVNYRNFMLDDNCPSSASIWNSKMGIWRYDLPFLLAFGNSIRRSKTVFRTVSVERASELHQVTRQGSSPFARTNAILSKRWHFNLLITPLEDEVYASRILELFKTRILDFYVNAGVQDTRAGLEIIQTMMRKQYGFDIRLHQLQNHIKYWTKPSQLMLTKGATNSTSGVEDEDVLHQRIKGYQDSLVQFGKQIHESSKDEAGESLYDAETIAETDPINESDEDNDDHDHLRSEFNSTADSASDEEGTDKSSTLLQDDPSLPPFYETIQNLHDEDGAANAGDSASIASSTTQVES